MKNYEFHKKLRERGMSVTKLARLIGNTGHAHVVQVLNNMPGHGLWTRRRLFAHLTADEVRLLGWEAEFDRWRTSTAQPNEREKMAVNVST